MILRFKCSLCDAQWREHGARAAERSRARGGVVSASAELLQQAQLRFGDAADAATPSHARGTAGDLATPGSDASVQTINASPSGAGHQHSAMWTPPAGHVDAAAGSTHGNGVPQHGAEHRQQAAAAAAPLDMGSWASANGSGGGKNGGFGTSRQPPSSGGKENLWLTPVPGSQGKAASPKRAASPDRWHSRLSEAFGAAHLQQHGLGTPSEQQAASASAARRIGTADNAPGSSSQEGLNPGVSVALDSARSACLQPGQHSTEVRLRIRSSPRKRPQQQSGAAGQDFSSSFEGVAEASSRYHAAPARVNGAAMGVAAADQYSSSHGSGSPSSVALAPAPGPVSADDSAAFTPQVRGMQSAAMGAAQRQRNMEPLPRGSAPQARLRECSDGAAAAGGGPPAAAAQAHHSSAAGARQFSSSSTAAPHSKETEASRRVSSSMVAAAAADSHASATGAYHSDAADMTQHECSAAAPSPQHSRSGAAATTRSSATPAIQHERFGVAAAAAAVERRRAEVQAEAERLAEIEWRLAAQQADFEARQAAADAVLQREQVGLHCSTSESPAAFTPPPFGSPLTASSGNKTSH